MLTRIKTRVEREIVHFAEAFQRPPLDAIPRPFAETIGHYVRRGGKRLRSVLFVLAYKAYAPHEVRHLYRSAAALEVLHDFILVHDDLIDRSSLRRGGAAMHTALDELLRGQPGLRFRGQDLALIVGDMLYAMAIQGFLAIETTPLRKQRALEMLTRTALFTGCGELDELLHTLRALDEVTPDSIYRIYDWKTGHYTFSSPLAMGAVLGGADARDVALLESIGTALGRAFQIKDDLMDLYGDGDRYGKPALLDVREGKKTLPVWFAYHACVPADRALLERVLGRPGASDAEIRAVARVIDETGAGDYAAAEMARLQGEAMALLARTKMAPRCRAVLATYAADLLRPPARRVAAAAPVTPSPRRANAAKRK